MTFESSFQEALGWAGAQTTNTIKTSKGEANGRAGHTTKPGARRAGNSNKNGKHGLTGWEDSR